MQLPVFRPNYSEEQLQQAIRDFPYHNRQYHGFYDNAKLTEISNYGFIDIFNKINFNFAHINHADLHQIMGKIDYYPKLSKQVLDLIKDRGSIIIAQLFHEITMRSSNEACVGFLEQLITTYPELEMPSLMTANGIPIFAYMLHFGHLATFSLLVKYDANLLATAVTVENHVRSMNNFNREIDLEPGYNIGMKLISTGGQNTYKPYIAVMALHQPEALRQVLNQFRFWWERNDELSFRFVRKVITPNFAALLDAKVLPLVCEKTLEPNNKSGFRQLPKELLKRIWETGAFPKLKAIFKKPIKITEDTDIGAAYGFPYISLQAYRKQLANNLERCKEDSDTSEQEQTITTLYTPKTKLQNT